MGIAALVIGIVSVVLGFVPFCNYFALIPAVVGLILGILEVVQKGKKSQPKGMGIAGIILNVVAILVILIWTLVIAAGAKATADEFKDAMKELEASAQEIPTEPTDENITDTPEEAPAEAVPGEAE